MAVFLVTFAPADEIWIAPGICGTYPEQKNAKMVRLVGNMMRFTMDFRLLHFRKAISTLESNQHLLYLWVFDIYPEMDG